MAEKRKRPIILDDSDEDQEEEPEEEEPLVANSKRTKKPTLKKSMTGEMFYLVLKFYLDFQLELEKENIELEAKKLAALKKQVAKLTRKMKDSEESVFSKGNVTYRCPIY